MIYQDLTVLGHLDQILDDLVNPECGYSVWCTAIDRIKPAVPLELTFNDLEPDKLKAKVNLLRLKTRAGKLLEKTTTLKNSPDLGLSEERILYIEDLEELLQIVLNWEYKQGLSSFA
ncbi:hypothetical protein D3C80_1587080 [compost metagenome]